MRYAILVVPILILAGCYTPPTAEPAPQVTVPVAAPPGAVMDMVPGVLADFGWAVDDLDRGSGFVRTSPYEDRDMAIDGRPMSEFFDCGLDGAGRPEADRRHTFVVVRVLVEDGETGAVIRPQATAREALHGTECVSTGALERLVARAIADATTERGPGRDAPR